MTSRLRQEGGSALITTMLVLAGLLTLSGVVFAEAGSLNRGVRRAQGSQRAFQAAQAGIDQALGRINVLKGPTVPLAQRLAAGECATTVRATPNASGWCDWTSPQYIGANQSFTYRTSKEPLSPDQCAGESTGGRCIVAVGTADGVTARIRARIVQATEVKPFVNTTSVVGYSEVKIKKGAEVKGAAKTNKKLRLEATAKLSGNATLGPKAKVQNRGTISGTTTRSPTPFVPALPDFFWTDPNTGQRWDTAVRNDNLTLVNAIIANPAVSYSGNTTRELVIGDRVTVTIPAGIYNFCKLTLGKDARINIAPLKITDPYPRDAVRIFIDSKDRAGSQCRDRGTLDAKTGASFVNSNTDPRSFQLYAWSKRSRLKVANKQQFAAIIYAPLTKVSFNSAGQLIGGVAADKVDIHKAMKVDSKGLLESWTVTQLAASSVVAWNQCPAGSAAGDNASDPQAGC